MLAESNDDFRCEKKLFSVWNSVAEARSLQQATQRVVRRSRTSEIVVARLNLWSLYHRELIICTALLDHRPTD